MQFAYSGHDAYSGPGGVGKGVEAVIVATIYKKLVSKLIPKMAWLKQPENLALYSDVRSLMNYIRCNHGNVFRRVVLSALLDSAHKMDKSQQRIDRQQIVR